MKGKIRSRFFVLLTNGELQLIASALSFSTLLSIIPFIAVTLAAIQYIHGIDNLYPQAQSMMLQYFQGPMGNEGVQAVQEIIKKIHSRRFGALGAVALVLASILLINHIEKAFHRIWNLQERRPLHKRIFLAWTALILFPGALAMYTAVSSIKALSDVTSFVPVPLINSVLLFATLFFLYKIIPNTKVSIKAALCGAAVGSIGMIVLWRSFKWISQSFFSWNKVYGGFAAIPAFLIWVLLFWYVILFAAAIAASFHKEH
jgi:membrane protein